MVFKLVLFWLGKWGGILHSKRLTCQQLEKISEVQLSENNWKGFQEAKRLLSIFLSIFDYLTLSIGCYESFFQCGAPRQTVVSRDEFKNEKRALCRDGNHFTSLRQSCIGPITLKATQPPSHGRKHVLLPVNICTNNYLLIIL